MAQARIVGTMPSGNPILEVDAPQIMEIYGLPAAQHVLNYLLESQHGNWDGFPTHHRTGINAMLRDMWLYATAADKEAHGSPEAAQRS